jgi:NNP family nitrate/nitrite transporter-like MFS transporter
VSESWGIALAVAVTLVTSIFVQAACGAVYSIVPLIQRQHDWPDCRHGGRLRQRWWRAAPHRVVIRQPTHVLSWSSQACRLSPVLAANFIDEPKGHMVEVDEHGNVQMIAVE